MNAGPLRHRISIMREGTETRDAVGGVIPGTPIVFAERWGEILKLAGREAERAKAIHAEAEFRVRLRYIAITTKDWLIFNGRTFQILDINNVAEMNAELIVLAKETI